MIKKFLLSGFGALVLAFSGSAQAVQIDLVEYIFNIDGTLSSPLFGDPVPAAVDLSAFDDLTGLGNITVTIGDAGTHWLGLFVDHEIDEATNTFFNEYGEDIGAAAAGQSWEIDDPFLGFIYDDFLASDLWDTNYAPQGGCTTGDFEDIDAGECWDVSMALGWDFTLGIDETATITFFLSDDILDAPGFFLTQTDPASDASIYFWSTLDIDDGGEVPVPEPGTLWLLGAGLFALGLSRRRITKH